MNELLTRQTRLESSAALHNRAHNVPSATMKIGQIALFAALSFTCTAQASDYSVSREQWKARVAAAKSRIQEMRREGKSFIPPPEENLVLRILEDNTLVFGDIVTTKQGMFRFVGRTETPHNLADFTPVAPDQVFDSH